MQCGQQCGGQPWQNDAWNSVNGCEDQSCGGDCNDWGN
jgi:hypothetical protein